MCSMITNVGVQRSEACVDDHAVAIAQGPVVKRGVARSFSVPRLSGDSTVSHRLSLLTQLIPPTAVQEFGTLGPRIGRRWHVLCPMLVASLLTPSLGREQGVDREASNASRASSKMAMMKPRAIVAIIRMYTHTTGVLLGVCLWQDGGIWLFCGYRTVTSVFHKNAPKAPER